MKNLTWGIIVVLATFLSGVTGFMISSHTGIEPGFEQTAESGGYGSAGEKDSDAGEDILNLYKTLKSE